MNFTTNVDGTLSIVSWLAYSAIKATAVLLLALAFTRWRGTSASTRHAIWCAGIIGAVAMPVAQVLLPSWNVAVLAAAPRTLVAESLRVQTDDASSSSVAMVGGSPAAGDLTSLAAPTVVEKLSETSAPSLVLGDGASGMTVVAAEPLRARWPLALFSLWALGAALFVAPWLLGRFRLRRLWAKAYGAPLDAWGRVWCELPADRSRRVELRVSRLTSVPMTWGIWHPVILVPAADQWSLEEQRAALLHEAAHIGRFDTLWQGASRVMLAVFWFNPLAWIADTMLRAESERACDDAVLRAGAKASDYAQQLVHVLRDASGRQTPAVAALAMARQSGMARRLRALLDAHEHRGTLTSRWRVAIVMVTGTVAVPLARLTPVQAEPENAEAAPAVALPAEVPARLGAIGAGQVTERVTAPADRKGAADSAGPVAATSRSLPESLSWLAGRFGLTPSAASATSRSATSDLLAGTAPATLASLSQAQGGDCMNAKEVSSSLNWQSSNGRNKTMRVKWSSEGCRFTFDLEGDLVFNADATDIVSLSRGGSLELTVKEGSTSRRVTMDENGGSIDRKYWVDGDRKPWDSDATAWFARALVALDRRTAFAADQRIPVLLKQGGVDAVLAEVEHMGSDYAARVYYTKLFKLQPLSTAQVQRVLVHAATEVKSDYERAELLLEVAKLNAFSDDAYVAFANAAGGIKSDYEKRRALSALLARRDLKLPAVKAMLEAAQGMTSDYELAELLIGVSKQYAMSDDTRPLYLSALGSLESDYEHRRVLDTIVRGGGLTPVVTRTLLTDAARIKSDYELSEFLVGMASSGTLDASNANEFFAALGSIKGDYEYHRALTSVLKKEKLDKDFVLRVLEAAGKLNSDYERASLLVEVAAASTIDDALRPAYEKAANGIKSEYEYGRAMQAIRRTRSQD